MINDYLDKPMRLQKYFVFGLIPFIVFILLIVASPTENAFVSTLMVVFYLGILAISYRWPWIIITITILTTTNFFHLYNLIYLPSLRIASGVTINFLDALLLGTVIISIIKLFTRKSLPLLTKPVILLYGIIGLSLAGSVLIQKSISLNAAVQDLRQTLAFIFYLSLAILIQTPKSRKIFFALLTTVSIISIGIHVYEFITQARLVLPTSSPSFYSETRYINVGGRMLPYLWNRAPNLLFLMYYIHLAKWFLTGKKRYIIFTSLAFISVSLSLVRFWFVATVFLSILLSVFLYFKVPRTQNNIKKTTALILIGLAVFLPFVAATTNILPAIFNRLISILNPSQEASVTIRLDATQIFWNNFVKNPILGNGPGSNQIIENQYGVWASDVGLVAALNQYGIFIIPVLIYLLSRITKMMRSLSVAILSMDDKSFMYGIGTFFILALFSSISIQDYFFSQPWNYSVAIAVVLLENTYKKVKNTNFSKRAG